MTQTAGQAVLVMWADVSSAGGARLRGGTRRGRGPVPGTRE